MKPNVILITIDALRADHLGYMGYKKNTSPNIDALAKESAVFTNAYSNGPMTPHSFPSILTSTYPLDYQGPGKIERPRVLISEVLQKNGYITAAFTFSNGYLSNYFGYNKGWDFFEDFPPLTKPNKSRFKEAIFNLFKEIAFSSFPQFFFWIKYLGYKRKKGQKSFSKQGLFGRTLLGGKVKAFFLNQTAKEFINSLSGGEKPFFLWIHYMDVHSPYLPLGNHLNEKPLSFSEFKLSESIGYLGGYPRKTALRKFNQRNLKQINSLYDQGIKYLDLQIGNLISFLKRKALDKNSVIFLTADHGDEFLEHGGGFHLPKLYNELLHVPLLVKIPDSQPRKIETKVSLIDLPPTICDILGVERPFSFKGKNLFSLKNTPIFHQTALNKKIMPPPIAYTKIERINQCKVACQYQGWKYILNHDTNTEELYNLSSDPEEQNNLVNFEKPILAKMRKTVQEFEKENPPLYLVKK